MTENLEFRVPVHVRKPSGFVAQKCGPETDLRAPLARGDEKQVFFVRSNDKEEMPLGEAMPAVMDAARPPGSPRSLDGQPRRPGSGLGRDLVHSAEVLRSLAASAFRHSEPAVEVSSGLPVANGRRQHERQDRWLGWGPH